MRAVTAYLTLTLSILLAGVSPVFFKLAVTQDRAGFTLAGIRAFLTNPYALVGLSLYLISSVLWLVALSKLPASLMYPLLSLAYVITVFLAARYLGENVHPLRWLGVVLIVIGSALVGMN